MSPEAKTPIVRSGTAHVHATLLQYMKLKQERRKNEFTRALQFDK